PVAIEDDEASIGSAGGHPRTVRFVAQHCRDPGRFGTNHGPLPDGTRRARDLTRPWNVNACAGIELERAAQGWHAWCCEPHSETRRAHGAPRLDRRRLIHGSDSMESRPTPSP